MAPLGNSAYRASPPATPPAAGLDAGPLAGSPEDLRTLVVPPPGTPPAGTELDYERIGRNALATGGAFTVTYAAATALKNAARACTALPMPLKALACALPAASVFASPYVEDRIRDDLGTRATHPSSPSLGHYAVSSGALFTSGIAMQRALASLPKPSPLSVAGAACTIVQAGLASVCAGGATELDAQLDRQAEARAGGPPAPSVPLDPAIKGAGRSRSLVLPALVEAGRLVTGRPPLSAPTSLALITASWSLRGALMPEQPCRPGLGAVPPIPPTDIPPA